jgi:RHS repeat-associated protein
LEKLLQGAGVETYTYAADGMRRRKVTASGTTNYLWDGQNVLAELDAGQVTQAQYTQYPGAWGGLTSQRRSGVSSFYSFDLQGSTRALVSAVAAITDSYSYKAFGAELAVIGSTVNPFRYVGGLGYYCDSSTRYYAQARHLDAGSGRWMSRDPLGLAAGDVNPYRYVFNSPLILGDPTGLFPAGLVRGGASIGTPLVLQGIRIGGGLLTRGAILWIGAAGAPLWLVVAGTAAVVAIGVGVYWWLSHRRSTPPAPTGRCVAVCEAARTSQDPDVQDVISHGGGVICNDDVDKCPCLYDNPKLPTWTGCDWFEYCLRLHEEVHERFVICDPSEGIHTRRVPAATWRFTECEARAAELACLLDALKNSTPDCVPKMQWWIAYRQVEYLSMNCVDVMQNLRVAPPTPPPAGFAP